MASLVTSVSAQTNTWIVPPVSGLWSDASKWQEATGPSPGGGVAQYLTFLSGAAAYTATNDLAGSFAFNQIAFATAGAATVGIAGNELIPSGLSPAISSELTQTATISNGLALQSDLTIRVASTGQIVIGGNISGSGFNLIRDGAGSGALVLRGTNVFTGNIVVRGGVLLLNSTATDASLGAAGNTVFLKTHRSAGPASLVNDASPVTLRRVISVDQTLNSVAVFGGAQKLSFALDGVRGLTGGSSSALLIKSGANELSLGDAGIRDIQGTWRLDAGILSTSGANDEAFGALQNGFLLNGGILSNSSSIEDLNFSSARRITLLRTGFTGSANGGTLSSAGGGILIDEPNQITGLGGFNKTGPGMLVISQPQDFGGFQTVQVHGGVLRVSSDSALGAPTNRVALTGESSTFQLAPGAGTLATARNFSISNAAAVIDTNGSNLEIQGRLDAGTTGFTKAGAGTLSLAYLGGTGGGVTVTGGVLRLNGAIPSSRGVALEGGNLELNGFSTRINSLSGTGGVLLGGSGSTALTLQGFNTYEGAISGAGRLVVTGGVYLSGNNPFSGSVEVEGGHLWLLGDQASGKLASATSYAARAGGRISVGDDLTLSNYNTAPRLNQNASVTLGGATGGGWLEINPGVATLTETVRSLHLQPGANTLTFRTAQAKLQITGGAQESITRVAGSTVDVPYGPGANLSIRNLPSSPRALSNFTLVGWTLNGYEFVFPSTPLQAATIVPQPDPNLWTDPTANYTTTTANPSASLASSRTINALRIGGGFSPALVLNSGVTLTLGTGMILSAVSGASINGGTLTSANLNDVILLGNGETRIGSTIANRNGTPIGFTKAGAGTVTIGNGAVDTVPNLFTGPTTINEGTLILDKAAGTSAIPGDVSVLGGTLRFARAGQIATAANVTLSGGAINFTNNPTPNFRTFTFHRGTVSNLTTMTLNGSGTVLTMDSGTTLPGGIALTSAASTTLRYAGQTGGSTISGTVKLGTALRSVEVEDGDATVDLAISGVISGGSFTKVGAGRLDLTNSGNAFSGNILVNSGTLGITANGQLGAAGNDVILDGGTLATNGAITLGSSRIVTMGSLGGRLEQTTNTLTLSVADQLVGSGTLTKAGGGTLLIAGDNPRFAGGIVIAAGTLAANSAGALGPVTEPLPVLSFSGGSLSTSTSLNVSRSVDVTENALISGSGSFTSSGAFKFLNSATLSLNTEGGGAFHGTLHGHGVIAINPAAAATVTFGATTGEDFSSTIYAAASNNAETTVAFTRDLPSTRLVLGALSQTSSRSARVALVGPTGFDFTSSVSILHDPASMSGGGFTVQRNGPGLAEAGQVFRVIGDVTGNGSVTIGGTEGKGVGEIALAGALMHTGSASSEVGPGARFATGSGGLLSQSGAFVRFTEPTQLPRGGAHGQTSYIGAFSAAGGDLDYGYIFQGSPTAYSFPNSPQPNASAYKFIIGSDSSGSAAGVLGAADGPVTLRSDVLVHSASDANSRLGLLARSSSLFTLGDPVQAVRFQPAAGSDLTDSLNTNALATAVRDRASATTLMKVGEGTVALGNVQYTDVGGIALANPQTRFAWQIGRGSSGNSGANSYFDGGLRETGNTATSALSDGITTWGIQLRGGVLESNNSHANYALTQGRFARSLGWGNADVNWGPGGGGFSAVDGAFTINIGGLAAPLEWESTGFVGAGEPLIFGSRTADSPVTLQNPIALANASDQPVIREIRVIDNSDVSADRAVLEGEIRDRADAENGGMNSRSLLKTGDGVLELAGAINTFNGATLVEGGTLLINGELSPSIESVIVRNGATLGGTGQISRPVTVEGMLSPGDSVGRLELTSSLVFAADSVFRVELGGPAPGEGGGSYDQLNLTSSAAPVSISSTSSLLLTLENGYVPTLGSSFFLLTQADSNLFDGSFADFPEGSSIYLGAGRSGTITYRANWTGSPELSSPVGGNDFAVVNVVPEVGATVFLLNGALLLSFARRRPKRSYSARSQAAAPEASA